MQKMDLPAECERLDVSQIACLATCFRQFDLDSLLSLVVYLHHQIDHQLTINQPLMPPMTDIVTEIQKLKQNQQRQIFTYLT